MTYPEPILKIAARWWQAVALLMPSPHTDAKTVGGMPALARPLTHTREMAVGEDRLLADLYVASVRELGVTAYSEEQVATWSSFGLHFAEFQARLQSGLVIVAEGRPASEQPGSERILGFGQLQVESGGHLSLLYTSPLAARQGVATQIYRELENHARALGLNRIYTEASHLSRPFFTKQGFGVIEPETVVRQGVKFERFRMEKSLA